MDEKGGSGERAKSVHARRRIESASFTQKRRGAAATAEKMPHRLGDAALEALTNAKLYYGSKSDVQPPAALPLDVPPTPQKTDALYLSVWAPFANGGEPVQGRHFTDALQLVATCHRRHGRLDFAETAFLRVLEVKQKICAERPDPPSHCELADTVNDLGLVHLKQGKARLQDAEAGRLDPLTKDLFIGNRNETGNVMVAPSLLSTGLAPLGFTPLGDLPPSEVKPRGGLPSL